MAVEKTEQVWTHFTGMHSRVSYWHAHGFGIVRRFRGSWYGANDTREFVVGTTKACGPRVGPCASRIAACIALEKSWAERITAERAKAGTK